MDRTTLQELIDKGLSTHEIAKHLNTSQTNARYWLKKFNLKTNSKVTPSGLCLNCQKPLTGRQTRFCCKKCNCNMGNIKHQNYQSQKSRGLERKKKLVILGGGSCSCCGYNKNYAALVFHHVDPTQKENELDARKLSNSTWDWCLKEFAKCILLCANCHAELHNPSLEKDGGSGRN